VALNTRDIINWTDGYGVIHTYVVVGFHEPGGLQAIWTAACEERT
jgi:hypothetical protein